MELFLTFKLYLQQTELFNIELFWHSTAYKQNLLHRYNLSTQTTQTFIL